MNTSLDCHGSLPFRAPLTPSPSGTSWDSTPVDPLEKILVVTVEQFGDTLAVGS